MPPRTPCATFEQTKGGAHPFCSVLRMMAEREISFLSASGNNKSFVLFPANEPAAIAVGGIDRNNVFWDETLYAGCQFGGTIECGSNFGIEQDFVAPARKVLSAVVPDALYNLICQDTNFGTSTDGFAHCTGTSMSAPQVTGLLGLLRSLQPLAPAASMYDVLKVTADGGGTTFTPQRGWGLPNGEAAAARILGQSCGAPVVNRLTPMFALRNTNDRDRLYTVTPQIASSAWVGNYLRSPECEGNSIGCGEKEAREYSDVASQEAPFVEPFNGFPGIGKLMHGRAAFDVFTSFVSPFPGTNLVPLARLAFAEECDWRDHAYVTTQADFDLYTTTDFCSDTGTQSYRYEGVEGYLLDSCPAQFGNCDGSDPSAPQALYLRYSLVDESYALVLSSQLTLPAFSSYTHVSQLLGYAFPRIDTDGDGLIDGFERVLGTDPTKVHSDTDGIADGVEYPPNGIPALAADPGLPGGCQ